VIAAKIAAHAADIARQRPGARQRDDALSRARFAFDWAEQFRLALDPETARRMHQESTPEVQNEQAPYCSMCGPKFCAMRINQALRAQDEAEESRGSPGGRGARCSGQAHEASAVRVRFQVQHARCAGFAARRAEVCSAGVLAACCVATSRPAGVAFAV